MNEITLLRPDDWHLHLRDGQVLSNTVADAARYFGRAVIMPNLVPPVTTTKQAADYRTRILDHVPPGAPFKPLMTLYLTDNTTPEEVSRAKHSGIVNAAKLYPAGATTNSSAGVTALKNIHATLMAMADVGLPLLVHGEVTDGHVDIFDREEVFINTHLKPLRSQIPQLKIVLEHITTQSAVAFVEENDRVAATITAHHLLYNRNHLLVGGIKPHYYCLPVLKRARHQEALIAAATSGNPKFFLGTDSAPHATGAKESSCGCAGIYSSFAALELYAEAFEQAGALDRLEAFASHYGPDFYALPRNTDTVTLVKQPWTAPKQLAFGDSFLTPLRANESIAWRVKL